jgi:glycosyltransferase EpsE
MNIELVLVQDGPVSEELANVAKNYMKRSRYNVIYLKNQKNEGLMFSLNRAIDASSGEFIARHDADDHSHPHRIENQVKMIEGKKLDILGTWFYEVNAITGEKIIRRLPIDDLDIKKIMPVTVPFCHGSVMFRRSAILKIGKYLEPSPNEDYGLWWQACRGSLKMGNLPEPLYYFKVDPREYYRRRSGLKLALSESLLRFRIIKEGHYPGYYYLLAIAIFFARLLPAFIVERIYRLKKAYGFF